MGPKGDELAAARAYWSTLHSDEGAIYDKAIRFDARDILPMVTWGTSPEAVIPIDGAIPDPLTVDDSSRRAKTESMLRYMGLAGGAPIIGTPIDETGRASGRDRLCQSG